VNELLTQDTSAEWWKEESGIPEAFVKTAAGMIQPRDSAIFALLSVRKKISVTITNGA